MVHSYSYLPVCDKDGPRDDIQFEDKLSTGSTLTIKKELPAENALPCKSRSTTKNKPLNENGPTAKNEFPNKNAPSTETGSLIVNTLPMKEVLPTKRSFVNPLSAKALKSAGHVIPVFSVTGPVMATS
ncbi:hypothetical protein F5I97DRAFT_1827027 [Phlebopus sp. FC_14]|nr:hypothetical protein F5I97DRAFT_1827027 [Phlebopus sp. FC_14]